MVWIASYKILFDRGTSIRKDFDWRPSHRAFWEEKHLEWINQSDLQELLVGEEEEKT